MSGCVLARPRFPRAAPRSGCRFLRRTTSCVGLPIEARPVDLVALAARVANRFQAAAGGRAIRVTAPRPVAIQGDATRLDRALSNLIDNAMRHGAGDIAIEIRTTGGAADLTVTHEGAGFAAHDTSPSDGNSLGLTIVREIARTRTATVPGRPTYGPFRGHIEALVPPLGQRTSSGNHPLGAGRWLLAHMRKALTVRL